MKLILPALAAAVLLPSACLNDRTLPAPGDGLDYRTCDGQQAGYVQRWGQPQGKRQLAEGIVLWAYYRDGSERHDTYAWRVTFDGHAPTECDITVTGHTP